MPLPSVDMQLARQAALWWRRPAGIRRRALQTAGSLVYPAWNESPALRITLDNGDDIYASPSTGEILAHVELPCSAPYASRSTAARMEVFSAAEAPASHLVLL